MLQPDCELLVSIIDQLTYEIRAIDDQIEILETEALDQQNLFQYFKLQSRASRLIKEQRILQGRWNRAMTELAICRQETAVIARYIDSN